MNVDKILDRKYQMTDAGKIDTIRELYTVFSPNVNLEALKKSDFFPALEQMMEPVLDVPDERSPQVMAYWAKRGMVKEFHGYDEPTDWDDYEAKTGYRWKAEEHRVIQNEHRIWTSFVPVSAFAPANRQKKYPVVFAPIFFWWKDGALCRRRPGANGSSSFRRWNWMNLCLIF